MNINEKSMRIKKGKKNEEGERTTIGPERYRTAASAYLTPVPPYFS